MKTKIYPALFVGTFVALFAFGLSAKSANAQTACAADINFDANPKTVRADQEIIFSGWVKSTQFNSAGSGSGEGFCNYGSYPSSVIRNFQLEIIDTNSLKILFRTNIPLVQYSNSQISYNSSGIKLGSLGFTAGQTLDVMARVSVMEPSGSASSPLIRTLRESAKIKVAIASGNYACVADDGKYACGQRSDCSDVPNNACAGKTCMRVNSSYCGKTIQITVSPNQTFKLGDSFVLSFTNPPENWIGEVIINQKQHISLTGVSTTITVSEANGFLKNGQNTLKVQISNSSSKQVDLPNEGQITVRTSETGTPGGPGPGTGTTSTTTLPTDRLYNPLPEENLTTMFLLIVRGFIAILGIWAVMFIIIGGFRMITAAGNEETYGQAKKTVTWAVLGLIVAMLSFSIVAIVQNLLQATVK
jgi:hypothetical protein